MNQDRQNTGLTFSQLALALADDYESVFVIDTSDDSYVEYTAENADKELTVRSSGADFYADTVVNSAALVHPDDRKRFQDAFVKENLSNALRANRSFFLNYRLILEGTEYYYYLKAIRSTEPEARYIIIGVRNVDAQTRRELAAAAKNRTFSEIANSLASLFEALYYVDTDTNQYTQYNASSDFSALGLTAGGDDFFHDAKRDIEKIIHPDDRAKVLIALQKEYLMETLLKNSSYSFTYRQILNGREQYLNMVIMKQKSTENIIIAVRNVDAQMRAEQNASKEKETYSHIARALASRYEVIYYIDIVSNNYTEYSSSEKYAKLGISSEGDDFFYQAAADIALYLHPDDALRVLHDLRKDNMLDKLRETGSFTLTYRQMLDGRPQYVSMLVVRPKNDARRVVIGVLNIDAQVRREQSISAESAVFGEISKALACRYEVIYYVDILTNEYTEYSSSPKYAKLEIGTTGKDFFTESQQNMKRDIYADDYPMMARAMEKEALLYAMADTGFTSLNYRLMLDGEPQYVTLFAISPKEDSSHIIVAVANVDAAKRREQEYRDALGSAMDLANRDALTGIKNKHAYVTMEMEMDAMIAAGNAPAFAIAVCDLNGLKNVNDTKGHSAGDDFIREACALICSAFQHSPVFRIGGDEFAVLLQGADFEIRDELLDEFQEKMHWNREHELVTVASGLSVFDAENDMRTQDVFQRADREMYEDKQIFKARQISHPKA